MCPASTTLSARSLARDGADTQQGCATAAVSHHSFGLHNPNRNGLRGNALLRRPPADGRVDPGALLLSTVFRRPIDLRRENKVVLRESPNRVGCQVYPDPVVGEIEVRMVSFCLC